MSYDINGKVYTEHALMDEIVYNCKIILQKIVIKNDVLANDGDEESFIEDVEVYMMIKDGSITVEVFPFTRDMLIKYGCTETEIRSYLSDVSTIPEDAKEPLLEFCCQIYMDEYVEKNNYYRMLMGLPEYGTDEYNIYIDDSYLPAGYTKAIDYSKPIHEFDKDVLSVLNSTGAIDQLVEEHTGSKYAYLRFLGDYAIDLYTARKASKYDILYMPSVESLVEDRFRELYIVNRDMFLKRTYSDAYAFNSDYYEQICIIMILCQTFNDMVVDTPEWYIRRDIFDIRSVQYFLESFGVAYYDTIPLKYQIRIVKNLNKLIKYKSSNKNFADILEIFDIPNTSIYKYYLFKKRKVDGTGKYATGNSDSDKYELEFVQAKINESYDDYIKDEIYRSQYDDITLQDKYWDGEDDHDYIKAQHLARDFTIEGTKYMSLEYKVDLQEYVFQMQYFVGLLLDSNIENDITIGVPSLQAGTEFKVSNLFLFLFLMSLSYDSLDTTIRRPGDGTSYLLTNYYDVNGGYPDTKLFATEYNGYRAAQMKGVTYLDTDGKYADVSGEASDYKLSRRNPKPDFTKYDDFDGGYSYTHEEEYSDKYSLNGSGNGYLQGDGGKNAEWTEIKSQEDFYDWVKKYYPEAFENHEDRVGGFNTKVDLTELSKTLSTRKHSALYFEDGDSELNFGATNFKRCYTLEELGVDKFIVPTSISTFQDLLNTYDTNRECYNNLKTRMIENYQDRDDYKVLDYVFNELFTKQFDYDGYKVNGTDATKLEEILKDRDYVLYSIYTKTIAEENKDVMKSNMRDIMNDIINTLEYYLSGEGLEYIFGFTPVSSFISLVRYILLMINFFKSYKVYFLDPYITYVIDDKLENSMSTKDSIAEMKLQYWKHDKEFKRDALLPRTVMSFEDKYNETLMEVLDIYGISDQDPYNDYDYDGKYADTSTESEEYKDADGGYADGTTAIPYAMINGGSAGGINKYNLWDLNGASAQEQLEYVDADGGKAFEGEDYIVDYWQEAFLYTIDGGSAGTNEFISNDVITTVIDRQISSNVLISTKQGNALEEKSDGLYMKRSWMNYEDYYGFQDTVTSTYAEFDEAYETLKDFESAYTDDTALQTKIDQAIATKLAGMYKVIEYNNNIETEENNINEYTDQKVQELYSEFEGYGPIAWAEI